MVKAVRKYFLSALTAIFLILFINISTISPETLTVPNVSEKAIKFRHIFNASISDVRVIAILSPTCPDCKYGQNVIQNLFKEYNGNDLKGIIVWMPMLHGDNIKAYEHQSGLFQDKRVIQLWDPNREIGTLYSKTLNLKCTAWDIYLIFEKGVKWESSIPPFPAFWMHQLQSNSGADLKLCLNPAVFTREARRILNKNHRAKKG